MSDALFKVGDRVKKTPMWRHDSATGSVIKLTEHYVVVKWDNINGDWHYTHEQAIELKPDS